MKNVLSKAALAALAAAGGVAAAAGAAHAQTPPPPTIQPMNGVSPEFRDGQSRFRVTGRFMYDISSQDWESPNATANLEDGTRSYVRRAFIGVQGRFSDHWRYKLDFNLAPGAGVDDATLGDNAVLVDDAWLEYAGEFFSVVIGENKLTSPLEDRTSSLNIPMIERSSIINAYGYGRAAGVAGLVAGANWMAVVGVYGDSLNNADFNSGTGANTTFADESSAVSGRFTWAPIFEASPGSYRLLHLGVSARQRYNGDDGLFRYRARPLNGRGSRWVESSSGNAVESDTAYGFEVAGQWNAFGFTGEYITITGETPTGVEVESDGYYIDANWSLTGEPRNYRANQGRWASIVPLNPVSDGGWGHWDVNLRYDFIDLTDLDAGTSRGEQSAWALGLNWVPVDHVRLMLNYAASEADRTAAGSQDADADIVTLRTQFDF